MQLGRVRKGVKDVRRGKVSKEIIKLSILLMCQKFLAYCWRNPHWEKVKLNFLFGFWKADLGCTSWIPKNMLADLAQFFPSVLSSHTFCSVATPGFCGDPCHCTHICNPASLKYCGYPNHCVKKSQYYWRLLCLRKD